MFDSVVLDVAIGLGFVYLLLALICSTVTEYISGMRKLRPNILRQGIERMLSLAGDKSGIATQFFEHPLIKVLGSKRRGPSYIPAQVFATVVLDLMKDSGQNAKPSDQPLRNMVGTLLEGAQSAAAERKRLEDWYDQTMDRVSGWYRRSTQITTIFVALAVTILANADTLDIARRLWTTPVLRQTVAERAIQRHAELAPALQLEYRNPEDPVPSEPPMQTQKSVPAASEEDLQLLGQLMGWQEDLQHLEQTIAAQPADVARATFQWIGNVARVHLVGWLMTALAVSLGAPFWFDTLNRIIKLRTSGTALDTKGQQANLSPVPQAQGQ